jgi:alpha-beta hydrolase superfamily lysophospholipase
METHEATWESADGLQLFERSWRPAQPKAAVVIVHGFAEHGGRYDYAGAQLAANGYATYALDLRGHGRSDGKRTKVRSFDEHTGDVERFLARVREREPGLPAFLLGHSMGGVIAGLMLTAGDHGLRGAILSGAALGSARRGWRIFQLILRAIGRLIPWLPVAKLDSAQVSRDPEVVQRYDRDPLVFRGRVSAGSAWAMIRAVRRVRRDMQKISLPLLILHGGADAMVDPGASRLLYERAGSVDKTLKIYDGLYHEILKEPERAEVLHDIVAWLDARVDASAARRAPAGQAERRA